VDPGGAVPRQRLLLLDVNNVLFADPIPPILERVAGAAGMRVDNLTRFYADTLRVPLWSGTISEPSFWRLLLCHAGLPVDPSAWRARLRAAMTPLPAAGRLAEWAAAATIWLLSNQRSEWLCPSLARLGLTGFVDRAFVSDLLGGLKPDSAIFTRVRDAWPGEPASVLFVDDQQANLDVGRELGFQTVHAGRAARWIPIVDRWAMAGCVP
jgi:HAD superfamily hydrolase (TIGR01509 family)